MKKNNDLDKVYSKYKALTNISCKELKKWNKNPCSKKASINREPIKRNIRLQCKLKNSWTNRDIQDAKKAISYLSRATKIKSNNTINKCKRTKNSIALRNWAFDDKK